MIFLSNLVLASGSTELIVQSSSYLHNFSNGGHNFQHKFSPHASYNGSTSQFWKQVFLYLKQFLPSFAAATDRRSTLTVAVSVFWRSITVRCLVPRREFG